MNQAPFTVNDTILRVSVDSSGAWPD